MRNLEEFSISSASLSSDYCTFLTLGNEPILGLIVTKHLNLFPDERNA